MALGGSLLRKSWLWLYCWLQTFGYWIGKVTGGGGVRFRRRLHQGKEKKSLLRLGRRIHGLYREGQTHWPEDAEVKEILQALKESERKREELGSRLQEQEDRYREKVQKLRAKASTQPEGIESVAEEDE